MFCCASIIWHFHYRKKNLFIKKAKKNVMITASVLGGSVRVNSTNHILRFSMYVVSKICRVISHVFHSKNAIVTTFLTIKKYKHLKSLLTKVITF